MGQYLPWLADAARSSGLPVVELVDWRNHHHGPMADHIYGTMLHHTAGPDPYPGAKNDFPSINIVRNGRTGLAGPLAQYGLGWNGTVYVVAGGLAYHAGEGTWRGVAGNSRWIGIEAEDAGDGDWSPAQLAAYPRLVAAIQDWLNQDASWVCAHREYAPNRKIDPKGIDMTWMRNTVLSNLKRGSDDLASVPQDQWNRVYHELTARLKSRVAGSNYTDTMFGYSINADAHGYNASQGIAALKSEIAEIKTILTELVARTPKA